MANEKGVWRTIGGRRVFIKEGQDLASAMKESGKFKSASKGTAKKESTQSVTDEELKAKYDELRKDRKGLVYNLEEGYLKDLSNEEKLAKLNKELDDINNQKENIKKIDKEAMDYQREKHGEKGAEEYKKYMGQGDDTLKKATGEKNEKTESNGKYSSDSEFKKSHHIGWGDYNKDGVPVYDNKIDYKGDFGWANLKNLSNEELTQALNTQSSEYHLAMNEKVGDQRTRNGRMDSIFKNAKIGKYEQGMNKLNEEMEKRKMPRYNIYDEKNNTLLVSSPTKEMAERQLKEMHETDKSLQKSYGWKELPSYKVVEEKTTVNKINNSLVRAGYKKYMKEHPNSKMTFEEYKNM